MKYAYVLIGRKGNIKKPTRCDNKRMVETLGPDIDFYIGLACPNLVSKKLLNPQMTLDALPNFAQRWTFNMVLPLDSANQVMASVMRAAWDALSGWHPNRLVHGSLTNQQYKYAESIIFCMVGIQKTYNSISNTIHL